jgi:hypothetical protein
MASWTTAVGSLLRVIFARESLPPELPPPPARRAGLLSTLFATEQLDELPERTDTAAGGRSPGALAMLFKPETLPEDPPPPPREGGRWFAWLFAPERLDD